MPETAGIEINIHYIYSPSPGGISVIIYSISKQLGRKFANFSMQIIIR